MPFKQTYFLLRLFTLCLQNHIKMFYLVQQHYVLGHLNEKNQCENLVC